MNDIGKYSTGIVIGIIIIAFLYFFYHVPEVKKAYNNGLAQCARDTDTIIVHAPPFIEYRDTSFHAQKPLQTHTDSSGETLSTEFDTLYVSGKDTINVRAKVSIFDKVADWFVDIKHRDFMQLPDTIKIYTPKYITKVETETNWLISGIMYVLGLLSAITIFLLT